MITLKHLSFILVALTWFEGAALFGHSVIISYGLFLGGIWLLLNLKKILKGDIAFTEHQFYFLSGLVFFLTWGLLSLTWAEFTQVAKERAFYMIGAVGFTVIILDQFREKEDWITAYKILVIAGLASSVLVLGQAYSGIYRATGYISPDPNFTAMRMTALVPLAYFWARASGKISGLFLLLGLLTTLLAIISTSSRAGILTAILTGLIISFYELKNKGTKKLLIVSLVLFAAGLSAALIIAPQPMHSGIERFENLIGVVRGKAPPDGSISERYSLLLGGVRMLFDNFLTGVGLGNFQVHAMEYGSIVAVESHNTYIEVATELGIIGAAAFFGLIYYTLAWFKRLERPDSCGAFISGCRIAFVSILINFLFLTALTDRRFYMLMAFAASLLGGKIMPLKEFTASLKQRWKGI